MVFWWMILNPSLSSVATSFILRVTINVVDRCLKSSTNKTGGFFLCSKYWETAQILIASHKMCLVIYFGLVLVRFDLVVWKRLCLDFYWIFKIRGNCSGCIKVKGLECSQNASNKLTQNAVRIYCKCSRKFPPYSLRSPFIGFEIHSTDDTHTALFYWCRSGNIKIFRMSTCSPHSMRIFQVDDGLAVQIYQ